MVVTVFRRRLREGKTYGDFEKAWEAEKGFGVPARVFNAINVSDPREVLSVAFVDIERAGLAGAADRVAAQERVRHNRIERVIEATELRAIYELVAEHDLSAEPRKVAIGSADSLLVQLSSGAPGGASS